MVPHDGDPVQGAVWLWDAQTGALRQRLVSGKERLRLVAFTTDSQQVVGWQRNREWFSWNLAGGQGLRTGQTAASRIEASTVEPVYLSEHSGLPCRLSACGCLLGDEKLALHDERVERALHTLEKSGARAFAMALQDSGDLVAVVKPAQSQERHMQVLLRDARTGKLHGKYPGLLENVQLARFSPDGKWLLIVQWVGGGLAKCVMWEHRTDKIINLQDHQYLSPTTCAFSPDGKRVAVGGTYGDVQLWDARTGALLAKWQGS